MDARKRRSANREPVRQRLIAIWERYKKTHRLEDGKAPTEYWLNEQCGWAKGSNGQVHQHLSGKRSVTVEQALRYARALKCKAWDIDPELSDFSETMSDPLVASNDYEFVQSYRLRHAAGSGRGQLDIDMDEVKMRLAFQRAWLMRRHLNIKTLEIGLVDGLSMIPKYEPNYTFLYDTAQREILNSKVYAIGGDSMPRLKRLFKHGNMIEISSDNKATTKDGQPEYPSEFLKPDEAKRIIIGRTVWHCGDD